MKRECSIGIAISVVALAAAMVVLFLFNPQQHSFYPRCVFNSLTGLDCPGCGGLRASYQILHGNIVAAFSLNPLLVTLLPLLGFFLLNHTINAVRGRPLVHFKIPSIAIWILVIVVVAFTVLRNLPFPAFSWMAASQV